MKKKRYCQQKTRPKTEFLKVLCDPTRFICVSISRSSKVRGGINITLIMMSTLIAVKNLEIVKDHQIVIFADLESTIKFSSNLSTDL